MFLNESDFLYTMHVEFVQLLLIWISIGSIVLESTQKHMFDPWIYIYWHWYDIVWQNVVFFYSKVWTKIRMYNVPIQSIDYVFVVSQKVHHNVKYVSFFPIFFHNCAFSVCWTHFNFSISSWTFGNIICITVFAALTAEKETIHDGFQHKLLY